MLDAGEVFGALRPQDRQIINVILSHLIRYGRIDDDFDGSGWPKVRWDDSLRDEATGEAPLSEATFPHLSTYQPRAGDYVAAILAHDVGRLIIGPIGNPVTGSGSSSTTGGITGTSATNITIGIGAKNFVLDQASLSFAIGVRLRLFSRSSGAFMEGPVTAFSGANATVTTDMTSGAGTFSDWNVVVAGQPGAQGAQGPQGVQGIQGAQGPQGNDGPAGVNAPQWFVEAGAPAIGLGADGDLHVDTNNGRLRRKEGGTWVIKVTFGSPT